MHAVYAVIVHFVLYKMQYTILKIDFGYFSNLTSSCDLLFVSCDYYIICDETVR